MNILCLALYICLLLHVQLTLAMDKKNRLFIVSDTSRKKGLPTEYIQGSQILMLATKDTQEPLTLPFSKEQFALAKKLLENEYIIQRKIEGDQGFQRAKKKVKKILLQNSIKCKQKAASQQYALIRKAPKEVAMIAAYLDMPRLLNAFVTYTSENPVYCDIFLPKSMDVYFARQLMILNAKAVDHIADYGLSGELFAQKSLDSEPSWFYKSVDPKIAFIPYSEGAISIEAVNGDYDLMVSYLGKNHTQDFVLHSINDAHDGKKMTTVCVRRDGQQFASLDTHCVCVWDTYSGNFRRGLKNKHAISAAAFAHTKPVIAVATSDLKLLLFNFDDGSRNMVTFNSCYDAYFDLDFSLLRREALALEYTPDDRRFAIALNGGTIEIYAAETFYLLKTIKHHIFPLREICFLDDGESLGFATNTQFGLFEPTKKSFSNIKELLLSGLSFKESKLVVSAYRALQKEKPLELHVSQNKQLLDLFINLPETLKKPLEQSCAVRLPYSYYIKHFF